LCPEFDLQSFVSLFTAILIFTKIDLIIKFKLDLIQINLIKRNDLIIILFNNFASFGARELRKLCATPRAPAEDESMQRAGRATQPGCIHLLFNSLAKTYVQGMKNQSTALLII